MTVILDEYQALTTGAGSWLAEGLAQFEVSGPDARAFANRLVTADLSRLEAGRVVDSLLLRDDATILDRVTVYRFDDRLLLVLSAGQRQEAWDHVVTRKRGNVRLRDISDDVVSIGVRGPAVIERLRNAIAPFPGEHDQVITADLAGVQIFAARAPAAGGPDGIDLFCRNRDGVALERGLGRAGVLPVESAAWRLVQLEWGVARVGLEIDPGDTPLEAGLEHLVAEGKGAPFPGEIALAARRRGGALKRLAGFTVDGEEEPPVAARVRVAGLVVDRVRSAAQSPRAGIIGMTAVPTTAGQFGTALVLEAGHRAWPATVARTPFVGSVTEAGAARPGTQSS